MFANVYPFLPICAFAALWVVGRIALRVGG